MTKREAAIQELTALAKCSPAIPLAEDKPILRPSEVAQMLKWSKNTVYGLLKSGELECIQVGGRFWIPTSALRTYLRLPAA